MTTEPFIRSMRIEGEFDRTKYPFSIPAVGAIESLSLNQPITFLVGENGSGKSTVVEALARLAGFNAEGGTKNYSFSTQNTTSDLASGLRLVRGTRREKAGFFLRAESFYNVASEADRVGMKYGGQSLHEQSHGESFLAIANHRFEPNGLYILDEPEAALSPRRQLSLLLRIHNLLALGSQFIIATHSPMLLSYPGAAIYELSPRGILPIAYEDTDHYQLTSDFLSNYKAYLAQLFRTQD